MLAHSTTSDIRNQSENLIERRKFERFSVKDGAMLAFISTDGRYYTKIAKIADISRGGAAFEHADDESHWSHAPCLEIFGITGTYLCIEQIPYKAVFIHPVVTDDAGIQKPKSCGLKFGELSEEQKSQLDHFIRTYGISN